MIKPERFTATAAADAGLIEAIRRGGAKVRGGYELSDDGFVEFTQKEFRFYDKQGALRVGKFENAEELLDFWQIFGAANKTTSKAVNVVMWTAEV